MLKRYGEKALEQTAIRTDELASDGDHDGAATWRRIANAIVQLANKTPPGPGIRRKAEPAALQRAPNSPEHGALQVRCPALTRPSADIIATAADDPDRPRCERLSRDSPLHRPPGRRLQQLLYLLLPELREEDGTVAARVFTTWNQE